MADFIQTVMAELETDPTIKATDISLDIESKGVFRKKRFLHIHGVVLSQNQVDRVEKIVKREAGNRYVVINHLTIR